MFSQVSVILSRREWDRCRMGTEGPGPKYTEGEVKVDPRPEGGIVTGGRGRYCLKMLMAGFLEFSYFLANIYQKYVLRLCIFRRCGV